MQMAAGLVDEPYNLPFDEVKNLTMRQVVTIYYRKRDKHGVPRRIEPTWHEEDSIEGAYKQFMEMGLLFGKNPEDLQKEWDEAVKQNGNPIRESE